ncbi:16S rRNA (cytosine(967)-C(5))-methyltransferase [Wohlfahrtiimonas chitiniclastica]|uniref:16S rRNA (cytosine(967)-C(5))-methyltransferase RsmB n=1 Tax=Wohlfahrtiimonas chitiniclastica TaxID=400946 RepID=UPI000B995FAA|nr:16S rRNA (cytosine(967)-C(5))-methyltransferase RsmB [Wohlfahrtiimonas chitiniclastica]OYQ89628.1 16S rRNA (cytosine(967)-C(5))-methyltransferase [Wohlfahrtiimonas chitiniclastica]
MTTDTTLNGVKVSYKPKSEKKAEPKKSRDFSRDGQKRVHYGKGQSKPSRPSRTHKSRTQSATPDKNYSPMSHLLKDPRYCAIDILHKVEKGQSLSELLATEMRELNDSNQRFVQHLVYGALRHFDVLSFQLTHYLQKPIKSTERQVYLALLLAMYEITEMNTAEYAAVNNWVALIRAMNKEWAVGLTNGILRKVLREGLQPLPKNTAKVSLPKWLSESLISHWGVEKACAIAEQFMQHPPMTIRVNPLQSMRDAYSALLDDAGVDHQVHAHSDSAIVLTEAVPVSVLPHFDEGMSSVQDASAQLAAVLINPQNDDVIVDACAAPGGKTVAMLERNPELTKIYAIDSVSNRLKRVQENVTRVFQDELADKVVLSANHFENFTADEAVDAILLDVPCSATGIIHRHPDIKRLRQPTDIAVLAQTQADLLDHAWAMLKVGGRLLYSTCSILKEENEGQMQAFFAAHNDAKECELSLPFAEREAYGYQILPVFSEQAEKMDGFYYCLIEKIDG